MYMYVVPIDCLNFTGNKMNNIDVVYTMWANLKKTQGMDVGQVGFFKDKEVVHIERSLTLTKLCAVKFLLTVVKQY